VTEERHPSAVALIWLFVRWMPAVVMVSFLTLWSLVIMGGMARVLGWLFITQVTPGLAFFVAMCVVIYALVRRRISRPMIVAWVLGLFVMFPALWGAGVFGVKYPASLDDEPAARIRVPSRERMRVYWGGDELEKNYHALYPDQRFAYDLVIEPAGTKSERLEDYGCYGAEVLAPAAGEIVVAHDGEPDQKPGEIVDEALAGNHIGIELSSKTYLLLAHLMPGSLKVAVGDQVVAGQPLAKCGNSGRTSEPHLHIHHQRQDPRKVPFGFAEGLPLFFEHLDGPEHPQGGMRQDGDTLVLLGDYIRDLRTSTTAVQ
jgi:hypothetical protein